MDRQLEFDFFVSNTRPESQNSNSNSDDSQHSSSSNEGGENLQGLNQNITIERKSSVNKGSQWRNSVKEATVTIKQMMNGLVFDLDYSLRNQIIRQVWKIFIECKRKNKEILMVMFNNQFKMDLAIKYHFQGIVDRYGIEAYQEAMSDFKDKMAVTMTDHNIRANLLQRTVEDKTRLRAFTLHLLTHEIYQGKIASRPSKITLDSIARLYKQISQEQNNLNEVFEIPKKLGFNSLLQIRQPQ